MMEIDNKLMANLLSKDVYELANLIQTNIMTSEEITTAFIAQIKQVNPLLNAIVQERFQDAIEEAKEKDKYIKTANFKQQPLYGVPISIKESFHVKGMQTTGGIVHRKDIIMNEDAEVVSKLKAAGAIIIGKTNTPSLCFCQETDNKLYGRTNNAWDITRTAGGSSGGEAALISVGGSPIGISSDIGGSIRFPSHFNGVIGFKPGRFQVAANGHFPTESHALQQRMLGIGPIGKSVRDVQLVYDIIANEKKPKHLFKKMDIEFLPNDNGFPLSTETGKLLTKVYQFLEQRFTVKQAIPPYFNDTALIWQEIMSINGAKEIKAITFNTDRANVWKEYTKERLTKNTSTHLYLSWALIAANMFKPSQKRIKEIEQFIAEGDRALERFLNGRLLIFPVYHKAALKHGHLYKEIFSIKKTFLQYLPYVTYANVWGLPSLTIPIGFDDLGLPIGIQIMSKCGNEDAIFSVGKLIEEDLGGYIRSTLYD